MIRARAAVSTIGLAVLVALCVAGLAGGVHGQAAAVAMPAPDLMFIMADKAVLPARRWLPPPGVAWRGVILALHGFSDSRDAWEYPAPGFAAAGYAVYAPDQRGFGATADRGGWAGGARLVDDAATLVGQLRARHPGLRVIVMGESMGGAVALCLAARPGAAADATVLLAPAVWGRGQMAPGMRVALALANGVAPSWVLSGSQVPRDIAASDNREALLRLFQDPLTQRASSIGVLHGLVDLMDAAQSAAPQVHGPALVLDGRRDQVIPPAATAAFWARLPAGVRRAFYLSGYHLLLRDQDRALVQQDVLSWLDDPGRLLPSGADVNAAAWRADHGWEGDPGLWPASILDGAGLRRVWPY